MIDMTSRLRPVFGVALMVGLAGCGSPPVTTTTVEHIETRAPPQVVVTAPPVITRTTVTTDETEKPGPVRHRSAKRNIARSGTTTTDTETTVTESPATTVIRKSTETTSGAR
jgi:hypothetical protein